MALSFKNIGKALLDTLDRDKERQGFQVISPKTRANLNAVRQGMVKDSQSRGGPWANPFNTVVSDAQTVLSPIKFLKGEEPSQFAKDVSYNLRGASQWHPLQWGNMAGVTPGSKIYKSQAPQTERERQAQSIGRSLYGLALTAPIGASTKAGMPVKKFVTEIGKNALKRAATGTLVGGTLGGGIAKITGEDVGQGFKQGALQGFKNSPYLAVTNPIGEKLIKGFSPTSGFVANQLGSRTLAGGINVVEDELLAKVDGLKNTNPERALSFLMAFTTTSNQDLIPDSLKTSIKRFLGTGSRSRLSPEVKQQEAKKLVEDAQEYISSSGRTYLRKGNRFAGSVARAKETFSTIFNNRNIKQVGNKFEVSYKNPVSGREVRDTFDSKVVNLALDKNAKIAELPTSTRNKVNQARFLLGVNSESLSNMAGFGMGIEPEYDEEGKFKGFKYNTEKGALGFLAMAGIKAVDGTRIKNLKKSVDTESAGFKSLEQLLNDPNRLIRMGYSKAQIDKINTKEARRIIEENIPPFEHSSYKQGIINTFGKDPNISQNKTKLINDPNFIDSEEAKRMIGQSYFEEMEGQKDFKELFRKWIGKREGGNTTATERAMKFTSIPKSDSWEVIRGLEGQSNSTKPEVVKAVKELRSEYDALISEARKSGVDVGYLENYATHIWKEPVEEVQKKFMSARGKFKYSKERVLPTYEEGIKIGLTPKFTNPAQILEAYVSNLEKAKANVEFITTLKDRGLLLPASVAKNNPDFKAISAPGIGENTTMLDDGKTYVGSWYAPKDVADTINRVFSEPNTDGLSKGLDIAAKISSKVQDITLSGGAPGTPINSFTIANLQKELLSGRVVSPVKAFLRSFSPQKSQEFFKENVGTIKKMQENNIPITSSFRIEDMIDKSTAQKYGWNSLMNDPTFKRFLPQLQIQFFNDIEQQALKSGKVPADAEQIAARALKNFYGTITTDQRALRSKQGQDLTTTLFFAPQFRESMVNFWVNNVKAISPVHAEFNNTGIKKVFPTKLKFNNPVSLENRANTKFLLGAAITYGAMDALNKAINGHSMSENPQGKEDKLLIPLGDGTTIGIPYLSSIATIPRGIYRQGKALVEGNPQAAAKDAFSTYTSSLLRPVAESMVINQDYFGNQIYDPTDPAKQKLAAQGSHLVKSYMHPFMREGLNVATEHLPISDDTKKALGIKTEKTPAYQTASQAMELPIRFYKTDSIKNAPFWDSYFKNKAVSEKYEELKYKDPKKALTYLQENRDTLSEFEKQKAYAGQYANSDKDSSVIQEYLSKNGEGNTVFASDGSGTKIVKTDKATRDFIKERIKLGDSVTNDELVSAYLGDISSLKTNTKYEQNIKTSKLFGKISDIENSEVLSEEQKSVMYDAIAKEAGISRQDIDYYSVARQNTNIKMGAIYDEIDKLGNDQESILGLLASGRREVNGQRLVNDTVIDNLYEDGVLSETEAKYLKSLKWDDKSGKVVPKKKKPKKVSVSTKTTIGSTKVNWKKTQGNGSRILNLSRPRGQVAGSRITGLKRNITV